MSAEPGSRTRTIRTEALARVEGEGAMQVRIRDGEVDDVKLRIFEPPRFFEAFLRGRSFTEATDITARICGICPVAYMTSAFNAMEDALGVEVDERIRALRRLMYCGEWIESHALHVFMLHAPDFLGFESAWTMAREHGEVVEGGLRIKAMGNEVLRTVGGRAIHPVNVRVGGFYKAPSKRELGELVEGLEQARELARESVRWVSTLDFPDFEQDYEFVALRDPERYAMEDGRLVSGSGLDIAPGEYEEHFSEQQVEHSTALQSRLHDGGTYFLGPMARYSLNSSQLSDVARKAAAEAGLGEVCRNPFKSIIVRAVEILYAFDEALRLISDYEPPDPPGVELEPRASVGCGWSEAPRGMLWQRYRLEEDGSIAEARIVPPTSQNHARIEQDLLEFVRPRVDLPDDRLQWECEQAIRNYDPCISCSTHFLELEVDRGETVVAERRSMDRESRSPEPAALAVIGVGNRWRGDDAVGPEVAARLQAVLPSTVRVLQEDGEPASLIEAWAGVTEALVVDAVRSGAPPGTLHRFEATEEPLPAALFRPSTHAFGVAKAVELARELGRLPQRLVVYGIEGERFDTGEGLTPAVAAAVDELVAELHRELGGTGPQADGS